MIQDHGERVYLYGHWMGSKSIGHAAHGLRSDRASDGSYLARIVFCSMVSGNPDGDVGYGISASMRDNQYPVLVIDAAEHPTVWFEDREGTRVSRVFSQQEFLDLAEASSWRKCDPFDPNIDHDTHDWPFEPFLADAPDPALADWVRDTGWPQVPSSYRDELQG